MRRPHIVQSRIVRLGRGRCGLPRGRLRRNSFERMLVVVAGHADGLACQQGFQRALATNARASVATVSRPWSRFMRRNKHALGGRIRDVQRDFASWHGIDPQVSESDSTGVRFSETLRGSTDAARSNCGVTAMKDKDSVNDFVMAPNELSLPANRTFTWPREGGMANSVPPPSMLVAADRTRTRSPGDNLRRRIPDLSRSRSQMGS